MEHFNDGDVISLKSKLV